MLNQSWNSIRQHAAATRWRAQLRVAHGLGWAETNAYGPPVQAALYGLFAANAERCGYAVADWLADWQAWAGDAEIGRDDWGKPVVRWQGRLAAWAGSQGLSNDCLHVSNTHDGGVHLVIAAHDRQLAGIGIDAVYLPRLITVQKDQAYLHRFAARFMSEQERARFVQASQADSLAELRLRTAAHFSLMEAASKACGTGLKVGAGMGRATSLPKQSLGAILPVQMPGVPPLQQMPGAARLSHTPHAIPLDRKPDASQAAPAASQAAPAVQLLVEGAAQARLQQMGVTRSEAYWHADDLFLTSVVLLWTA